MQPNEPSRTALMIARQRAAHQLLDHGSILNDPFAMRILREDEKDVLRFANAHPSTSIGRLFTASRSRIAEDVLSTAVERVSDRLSSLAPDSTLLLFGIPRQQRDEHETA